MLDRPGAHGANVTRLPSKSGYTFRTETVYTAMDSGTEKRPPAEFDQIAKGSKYRWHWEVYIAKRLKPSLTRFFNNQRVLRWRKQSRSSHSGRPYRLPRIPGATSWQDSILTLRDIATFMAGDNVAPLDVKLSLIPAGTTFDRSVVRHDEKAIPLAYFFTFPATNDESSRIQHRRFDSLVSMMTELGHEYLHALVATGDIKPYPNDVTEEASAYVFKLCLNTAFTGDPGYIRIPTSSELETMIVHENSNTSVGAYLANKNVLHLLGPGKIKGTDFRAKNRLFSLCRAMIRHPVDLTKQLYPLERLKPTHFFGPRKGGATRTAP